MPIIDGEERPWLDVHILPYVEPNWNWHEGDIPTEEFYFCSRIIVRDFLTTTARKLTNSEQITTLGLVNAKGIWEVLGLFLEQHVATCLTAKSYPRELLDSLSR